MINKKILTLFTALTLTFCGCTQPNTLTTVNIMEETQIQEPQAVEPSTNDVSAPVVSTPDEGESLPLEGDITDFAVRLFRKSYNGKDNALISPISVLSALSMTANGAKNNTLTQMENVFGLSIAYLNTYLRTYRNQLTTDESNKLHIANSLWFKDTNSFVVEADFLQINKDYYNAEVLKAAFDASTLKDINDWVDKNTDGMITKILDKIPQDAVMYLINVLAFDAEWEETYEDRDVIIRNFTKEDGTTQEVELMHSSENSYLESDNARGFIKQYKGQKYAFAALLPKEGMTIEEYVSTLSGQELSDMLQNPAEVRVEAAIPKFESEYSVEMSDVLKTLGMTDAFDENTADFSGIGTSEEGNLFINRVLHKTFISVSEKGTRAAAVTAIEICNETCVMEPEEPKRVYLDRPFVYLIIDCENNLPLFIGTVMSIEK